MKEKNRRSSGLNGTAASGTLKKCGIICIVTGVTFALFFIAVAAIITKVDVSNTALQPITTGVASLGTAVSGFAAAKLRKKQGLLTGCAVGAVVFVGILVLFLLFSGDVPTVQTLYKMVAFVSAGGLGGFLGGQAPNRNVNKI